MYLADKGAVRPPVADALTDPSARFTARRARARRGAVATALSVSALALVFLGPSWLPDAPAASVPFDEQIDTAWDGGIDPARVLLDTLSTKHLREHLQYYTSGTHVAGANWTQAAYTRSYLEEQGFEAEIIEYFPWLNRPRSQRVALFDASTQAVLFEAGLREETIPGDPASDDPGNLPAFHGYSAHGNVSGQLVYANHGTAADFHALEQAGIDVRNRIVLVRNGKVHCGLKVYAAERAGARGVLTFADPADDGSGRGKVYPGGPWRPESSIQRDSVQRLTVYPGDPLTPGRPSTEKTWRLDPDDAKSLNRIPSLPLSYQDALPLLDALRGHGVPTEDIGRSWPGRAGSQATEHWTGPSTLWVNLENSVEYEVTPVQNVIGRIKGWESPGQVVIIGNHRDAWSAGAADPSSGSSVLLELARALGALRGLGWRPRRTIILASWDAGEYGLVGSTEWVEENVDWLRATAAAYVNVGTAVGGHEFRAVASPALAGILYDATRQVRYPYSNESIYEVWLHQSSSDNGRSAAFKEPSPPLDPFAINSDVVPFALHAGISSMDFGFSGSEGARHSNMDSYKRMVTFIDPDMQFHLAMAQVWGLVTLGLVDDPVLRMKPMHYAKALRRYIHQLERHTILDRSRGNGPGPVASSKKLYRLRAAQRQLAAGARSIKRDIHRLHAVYGEGCQMSGRRRHANCIALRRSINERLSNLERHFIDPDGIPGREWYKHALVGPGRLMEPGHQLFPALAQAIEAGSADQIRQREKSIAEIIYEAAWFLREA
ncbi:Vacuolar protein sorting-associated protein 70 [Coemansia sp. RSA 552]|nr:Vacuolar protein sorting-associated protein 70 [Coemansia sp. RSA 552]